MNPRGQVRATVLLAALAVLAGLVWVNLDGRARLTPTFTELGQVRPPFVPEGSQLTGSWLCPGVPRGEGLGGVVVVSNPTDRQLLGWVTVMSNDLRRQPVRQSLDVPVNGTQTVPIAALQTGGSFVSALVELTGGLGVVEQRAEHPAGDAVSACSNATSADWYFADGFTAGGSAHQLHITNPYAGAAIVDIQLVTGAGTRQPGQLQGMPIPPRSVVTVAIDPIAKNETVVAATVHASRGRVVAARAQHYRGSGRLGYTLGLGAPSLFDQYYFTDNDRRAGTTTRYSVYNPNTSPITVTAVPITPTAAADALPESIEVAAGEVRTVVVSNAATSDIKNLPEGRFGMAFATSTASPLPFLVEKAVTRTVGNSVATTLVPGVPGDMATQRWSMVIGPTRESTESLRVLNIDGVVGTITVRALGPNGFVVVPGMDAVKIGPSASLALNFEDMPASLSGAPMLVDSKDARIFVERLLPRGHDQPGRSASIPLNG